MICKVCGVFEGRGECGECRALADEIRANTEVLAALQSETLPGLVIRKNPPGNTVRWWIAGAAAAAVLVMLLIPSARQPDLGTRRASEPIRIKLLTPDPDVVIYWLIDSKETDSQ
jgi:hypothetical protein